MKQIVTTIGLPFSGKSTVAAEYKAKGWNIVERDKLGEEISQSKEFQNQVTSFLAENNPSKEEDFQFRNQLMIQMLNQRLEKVFEESGDQIFYDAMNLQKKTREGLRTFKNKGYTIQGIYLNTPIEEILKRAQQAYTNKERTGFNKQSYESLLKIVKLAEDVTSDEPFDKIEIREFKPDQQEHIQEFKFK